MQRVIFIAGFAVVIVGAVFGYLAWLENAPESDSARLERLFQATLEQAEAGDSVAQRRVAAMYLDGRGTPQDAGEAATWYTRAARYDPLAALALGRMYEAGTVVNPDYRRAADLYLKAAEAGVSEAQYALGQLYFKGRGVVHDYAQAIDWFHRAAGSGHPAAQYLLGGMYQEGWGLKQDYVQAYKWLTLAMPRADEAMTYNPRYDPAAARSQLVRQMSRLQIARAEALVAQFQGRQ